MMAGSLRSAAGLPCRLPARTSAAPASPLLCATCRAPSPVVAEKPKLTPEQQYVKKLVEMQAHLALSVGGGAAVAGLDSSAGRLLAVQYSDPGYLAKLEAQLKALRRRVGIADNSPDWSSDSPQYLVSFFARHRNWFWGSGASLPLSPTQCRPASSLALQVAAVGLRAAMLRSTESRVERHVGFLAALQDDRQGEAQSGHASALIRSKIQYRVKCIKELMAVWGAWQRFCPPPNYQAPDWDIADVLSNVLPWTVASTAQAANEDHWRYKVCACHKHKHAVWC